VSDTSRARHGVLSAWSPLGFDASIAQLKALTEFTGRREMFIIFHQGNLRYEISASVPDVSEYNRVVIHIHVFRGGRGGKILGW